MSRCARLAGTTLIVLLILLAAPVAVYASSAWPMFGHDAAHSRRSQYVGAQAATLKWATSIGSWTYSSPALAADGTVYITADDITPTLEYQRLFALDPTNGNVNWVADTGQVYTSSSPAVATDGTVYLGAGMYSAPRGLVLAFASTGGTPKWTFKPSLLVDSSPTLDGAGNIYFGCDNGTVYSLNPTNGQAQWGHLLSSFNTIYSSPALDSLGRLYVGCITKMHSLDIALQGIEQWNCDTENLASVDSSPALSNDGGTVYFSDNEGTVYARLSADGKEVWTHTGLGAVAANAEPSSPGIGADGIVYVGGANGRVYALDSATGDVKWSYATGGAVYSSPAIGADGTVYVGSDDYRVYALNGATGAFKWSYLTGGKVSSSPAIGADGTIYVGSEDGKLYAIGGGPGPAACTLSTPKTSGTLKHTVAVTYGGTLTPARAAKVTLTFQRKKGSAWKAAFTATASTKATGVWTYKKKLGAATYRLRAATASTAAYKAATSGWKTVVIK